MAAHDIRDALVPIIGYAELIRATQDMERAHSMADRILQAADRLQSLADSLAERMATGLNMEPGSRSEGAPGVAHDADTDDAAEKDVSAD